jgi:hypothetical protein
VVRVRQRDVGQAAPDHRAELDALSPGDRAMNREARKQFMIRGPVVNTAQFAAIGRSCDG